VGLWGFGLEGQAALRRLGPTAAAVTVVADADPDGTLPAPRQGLEVRVGPDAAQALVACDAVVVSPGIPGTHPVRATLQAAGVELTSVTDLWLRDWADICLGVTGTKGKSTTAALAAHVCARLGRHADLAGNIGRALFDVDPPQDLVIAELGSYQCSTVTRSPRVAVITNLYEDHLTWFGGSREAYWRAKTRIATQGAEVLVCDAATYERVRTVVPQSQLPHVHVVDPAAPTGRDGALSLTRAAAPRAIATHHQWHNATLALAAVSFLVPDARLYTQADALVADFAGLPYRLETVAQTAGAEWVVDTLSTTAESVAAALDAFPGRRLVLLVGGQDRGIDYRVLSEALLANAARLDVVCLPGNGAHIAADFAAVHPERVHGASGMAQAVDIAWDLVEGRGAAPATGASPASGAVVLLSPGAPSYDHYRDYRAKAKDFCAHLVRHGVAQVRNHQEGEGA